MLCFKCEGNHLVIRKYTLLELKKGSPTRGKNKEFITVKVKHIHCKDCQSSEMEYS